MTTVAENTNIQESTFNEFTIIKNFEKFTVLIKRAAPRARFGYKVVYNYTFARIAELSQRIMEMNRFVEKFIADQEKAIAAELVRKAAVAQARKEFKSPYTVGQFFYDSWGYEQTNVNFYQVIAIKGKKVTLREVAQDREETSFMAGTCKPVANEFIGDAIDKMVKIRQWRGSDKIQISLADLSPWDGTPKYWSAYY